ncbi:MAG: hypothetical protein ISP91_10075 [Pseudomonadales bacterium]|nr:hypothetical protein [Pseudomonadales bacterium]
MTDRLRLLLFTLFLLCAAANGEETSYFLLLYTPGPSWNEALGYEKQPGLKKHHDYLKELHLNDQVVMGGPVVEDTTYDALSAMLLRTGSLEEAQKLAAQDPGVQMRLVRAQVMPWGVNMSSMRFVRRRPSQPIEDPDKSFSIKRVDPESRLNISD